MTRWGSVDYRSLEKLSAKLDKLYADGADAFNEKAVKLLATRFLNKVIKRTPVGYYTDGRVGGTLRRGWTAKSAQDAFGGGNGNASSYANDLYVTRKGDTYEVTIENVVEYASYVEFGHRTRGGKGFVPGRFFMTISVQEVNAEAQKILQREVDKLIRDAFK